jgi:hypothetical protein
MTNPAETAQVISALGFAGYGIGCLVSKRMEAEFLRFRLPSMRVATGVLQIAASAGLLLGLLYPILALAASFGLCLMMLCAMWVRVRIRDPFSGFLQALACFVLNLYVFQAHLSEFFHRT